MNVAQRILGEVRLKPGNPRPPTELERTDSDKAFEYALLRSRLLGVTSCTPEQRRCPEVEPAIAKKPDNSLNYAKFVVLGPFPEGEEAIATDAWSAYFYAVRVLKGRFPRGEPAIMADDRVADLYLGRFPDAKP